MTRIWFNHWFRTAYSLIELMKQYDGEKIYVIGSHSNQFSPISKVCDEWYREDDLDESEYVDFCVEFCKTHHVDVFVPHRHMAVIAKNKRRFDELGVKLFSDSFDLIASFEDKARTYAFFKDNDIVNVPEYKTVTTAAQFEQAYKELHQSYENICVKFVEDEGGKSFRRITPKKDAFEALRHYAKSDISYDDLLAALKLRDTFDELMVMPVLDGGGVEVSVDCLKTDDGVIALPRFKCEGHIEHIDHDEAILAMTNEILRSADLRFPCDIQYRFLEGKPYLLEVNARMSGGLPMSCAAAGVNIPALALGKLLGHPCKTPPFDRSHRIVSNAELPIIIK